ncbi:MAG: hypothetical protein M1833_000743 [Piccolia ochrophora]|nr:MAG: hypothetical protein M1833_000743 [Piccolia ochrophora]
MSTPSGFLQGPERRESSNHPHPERSPLDSGEEVHGTPPNHPHPDHYPLETSTMSDAKDDYLNHAPESWNAPDDAAVPEHPMDRHKLGTMRTRTGVTLRQVEQSYERRVGRKGRIPPPDRPTKCDSQLEYEEIPEEAQAQLATLHIPYEQLLRMLWRGLVRWLITAVFLGIAAVILKCFQRQVVIDSTGKQWFNTLITATSLVLGLNIVASLKEMAGNMRWKILSIRSHSLREVDLILGCDSLTTVTKLLWINLGLFASAAKLRLTAFSRKSELPSSRYEEKATIPDHQRPHFGSVFMYSSWLFINLALQAVVALLGLTYNIDDAPPALPRTGPIQLTYLNAALPTDRLNETDFTAPDDNTQRAILHAMAAAAAYGTQGVGNASTFNVNPPYTFTNPEDNLIYDLGGAFAYQFQEWNEDLSDTFYTARAVNVTWDCLSFQIVEGGNGSLPLVKFQVEADTARSNQTQEEIYIGEDEKPEGTVFVTDYSTDCGPRCASVWGFQASIPDTNLRDGFLAQCFIDVSNVSNTTKPEHELSDEMAKRIAGLIGSEGFRSSMAVNTSYTRFYANTLWSLANPSGLLADNVGSAAATFAAAAIASLDTNNPSHPHTFDGVSPQPGVNLVVNWKFVIIILACLAGIQAMLFIGTTLWSNNVMVKDASYLSVARLLRPIVSRLGHSGCALTGQEISDIIGRDRGLVYGQRETGHWHHLDIHEDIEPTKRLNDAFPSGWYDGGGQGVPSATILDVDEDDEPIYAMSPSVAKSVSPRRQLERKLKRE